MGGAIQVALSFMYEAMKKNEIEFHFFLSKAVSERFEDSNSRNYTKYDIDFYATDSIISYFSFQNNLSGLEKSIDPDGVISIFGPCYWTPKARHIMGFANGYYLYEDTPFFEQWKEHRTLKYKLKKKFHKYLLKKEADMYWVETNDSKLRLARFVDKDTSKIIVATNNASNYFNEKSNTASDISLPAKKYFRLVYISGYYPHKNFEIIPAIISILNERNFKVEFIVTIPDEDFNRVFNVVRDHVHNLGPIHPKDCPQVYDSGEAVFVPTLLETFTAIYPEAMISNKPIITTDLSFANDLCHNAALFFKHDDPFDAAEKIISIMTAPELRSKLTENGRFRQKEFDTPEQRFEKVLSKLLNI